MASLQDSPFSASSSWNTPVAGNSTYTKVNWPGSTGYNYSVAWDSYSPAVYVAKDTDPLVDVSHPAGWGYPAGTVKVHMPAGVTGASGTDGELVVIDGDVAYNFWQFNRTSNTSATAASFGSENVVTGDGWGSKSPFKSAGITAVGASELGGLLVKAEADDGSIDHALQLVVDSKLVKPGFMGSAIAGDGSSSSGIVQEGQHLAIAPDAPMPAGLSALGQEVFTALKKYGAYVVDVAGGVTNIRAQENAFDASTITALWHDMGNITPLLQSVSGGSSAPTASNDPEPSSPSNNPTPTNPTPTNPTPTKPPTTASSDPDPDPSPSTPTGGGGTGHHGHWDQDTTPQPARNGGGTGHHGNWDQDTAPQPARNGGGTGHHGNWAQHSAFQLAGRGTLGFGNDGGGHRADGVSMNDSSQAHAVSLFNQYAAASFPKSGHGSGGWLAHHDDWTHSTHTLAKSHA